MHYNLNQCPVSIRSGPLSESAKDNSFIKKWMEETKELRFKKDVYKNRCGFDNNGRTSGKREIEN